jgi:hypothetical protein
MGRVYSINGRYEKNIHAFNRETLMEAATWDKQESVALQALTNLGRLSSRRWQSFPTA